MNILELSEQEIVRREALAELRNMGIEPYPAAEYPTNAFSTDILAEFKDEDEPREVCIAGRMMSRRVMGKASFIELQDSKGRIQVYITRDDICPGENKDGYNVLFKRLLDIGDFVGIKGFVFRTQTGEITVHAKEITYLSKSIRPLPIVKYKDGVAYDKFEDPELRYRQRYVDLVVNDDVKEIFIKRNKIYSSMREFFNSRGYMEVETPVLQSIPGGAAARPFITHHNALDIPLYLRIANELYLKRLIVGGMNKVFELGKDFRNEGIDRSHNPEFTVLEVYEAYGDRKSMENIIEGLIPHLCDTVIGTRKIEYGEAKEIIDFTPPYRRVAYSDLVKEKMGDDWFDLPFETQLEKAKAKGAETETNLELDGISDTLMLTHEVYDKLIEKNLRQPTFVTRLPHEFVPLAKACEDDPKLVDVFEFVVGGRELCPGYTEQNNPLEQRKALENQAGEDTEKIDEDFISALECGMPPTGGLGIGVDRLVMLLTGVDGIRDVVLFPQMKKA